MPKRKRYENLLQSASTSQDASQHFSIAQSTPSHCPDAPEMTPPLQPIPLVQPTVQPTPSVQTTGEPAPPISTGQQAPSRKRSRRVSQSHWTVEAIDSQGVTKTLRVKKKDVLNLSDGDRVVIEFDDMGSAIGEAQGVLAGFCGILATDCSIFPMHFEKWSDVPETYFNRCFEQFLKPRFIFRTTESNARRYVYISIGSKWSAKRLKLFRKVNDLLKSRAEIMECVPEGVPRDQWTSYVDYRFKPSTKELCKRNAEIRKLQTVAHIGGSKPNSRRRAEMMAETGAKPGRGQLYLETHKNEDGSYPNEATKEICEKIETALSQSTVDESEVSANDAVGKVLGKEHSGRVRCLGLGVVPGRAFRQTRPRFSGLDGSTYNDGSCSSQCQDKYNQILNDHKQSQENYNVMMNAHTQMMNAFKAYMIMKEGTIPEAFAGIFVSPNPLTPSDASSGPISPMDLRRSSGGSNPNDNH